ncbi:NADP-dependent malic enzyme [Pseudonocardia sp. RS11V-5]|uniref:NAD(P)-dependent malic enzyme n=1 Tax=Pseudonocardia terrae TaxID=2905831 RepID=UPI001E4470EC|nr:NADP-dependent malic enzyme [Pseudonocardia terrae]MCE3554395.1 NADP-dependent malic enzyme [Pseudonocardia terrae]
MSDRAGKIEIRARVELDDADDLAVHYTPGVAEAAKRIAAEPSRSRTETVKGNAVAIVSDGSALLGLGDQGPAAALPVMEGKAALFSRFADIDAWPICIASREPDDVVRTVRDLATSFGAINLEDVAAPRCFEIERRLREELDIPVFHDDQHGTAMVVLAALHNALALTGRDAARTRVVIAGAGAAGSATARLLLAAGYTEAGIVVCDSKGALHPGRQLDGEKAWLAEHTNSDRAEGSLVEVLDGADVFIGVSAPDLLAPEDLSRMADRPVVFALANPDPEVDPRGAQEHAAVLATGRSDLPNQINNVLVFPGVLRGLLDAGADTLTVDMQLAGARAIAELVGDDRSPEHIVPSVFDERLVPALAGAVCDAAGR